LPIPRVLCGFESRRGQPATPNGRRSLDALRSKRLLDLKDARFLKFLILFYAKDSMQALVLFWFTLFT